VFGDTALSSGVARRMCTAVGDADARPDPFVQNQHLDHLRPFTDTHKILPKFTSSGVS
jgi:hypothetical protein